MEKEYVYLVMSSDGSLGVSASVHSVWKEEPSSEDLSKTSLDTWKGYRVIKMELHSEKDQNFYEVFGDKPKKAKEE